MSIMSDDTRIKRVKRKYGLEGYGLYVQDTFEDDVPI
jgi:hypothetical protein